MIVNFLMLSINHVWYKSACVVGDWPNRFANTNTGTNTVDNPATDNWIESIFIAGQLSERLINKTFLTIISEATQFSFFTMNIFLYDSDVLPFAGKVRLRHVLVKLERLSGWLQKILMIGQHLPQDGENSFIGENHLPGRFNPNHILDSLRNVRTIFFCNKPLPRI